MSPKNQMTYSPDRKQALLRFQQGIFEIEQGSFDCLADDEFVSELSQYIISLHRRGQLDVVVRILDKLGICSCSGEPLHRERAVLVVCVFAEIALNSDKQQIIQAISIVFSKWLRSEQEYLAGFEYICLLIQSTLSRMLSLGLFCQAKQLMGLLGQIRSGAVEKNTAIRKVVTKIHDELGGERFFSDLEELCLHDQTESPVEIVHLNNSPGEGRAELIRDLFTNEDRERRLDLILQLIRLGDDVAYQLVGELGDNSPWYVIRNVVYIISSLENPKLFPLVQPFLSHADIRVQQQVLDFVGKLDEHQMKLLRLHALGVCNDELKKQLIPQLGQLGGHDVEAALLGLLDNRDRLTQNFRDDLLQATCLALERFPSTKVALSLKQLISERYRTHGPDDRIVTIAEGALVSVCSS